MDTYDEQNDNSFTDNLIYEQYYNRNAYSLTPIKRQIFYPDFPRVQSPINLYQKFKKLNLQFKLFNNDESQNDLSTNRKYKYTNYVLEQFDYKLEIDKEKFVNQYREDRNNQQNDEAIGFEFVDNEITEEIIQEQKLKDQAAQERSKLMEIVNKYILKFYRSKFKDIRIIIESVCEQYINFEGGEKDQTKWSNFKGQIDYEDQRDVQKISPQIMTDYELKQLKAQKEKDELEKQ